MKKKQERIRKIKKNLNWRSKLIADCIRGTTCQNINKAFKLWSESFFHIYLLGCFVKECIDPIYSANHGTMCKMYCTKIFIVQYTLLTCTNWFNRSFFNLKNHIFFQFEKDHHLRYLSCNTSLKNIHCLSFQKKWKFNRNQFVDQYLSN